jgi:hypothetical protein
VRGWVVGRWAGAVLVLRCERSGETRIQTAEKQCKKGVNAMACELLAAAVFSSPFR